ncbi:MAG: two-component sensor histidine kinase [Ruminococcus sp.]|nr:two-component sensor histidine kinase [Ruminococcus sp.]
MSKIFPVTLLLLGLLGMGGTFTWIVRKGNNNRMTRLFTICQIAIILWLISQLLILFSVTVHQRWISYIIGNIGISVFSPFWLMFSEEYVDAPAKMRKAAAFLPIVSLSAMAAVVTDPLHRLYYSSFGETGVTYGPLFYVFQVIYYLCIITAITQMCIKHTRENDQITRQAILLTLSTAVPLAINTLTVTRMIKASIELTPLFFAFSSMLIMIALSRYGLLNINNIAMRDTIGNINSGVLIFDANDMLTYRNRAAEELIASALPKDFSGFLSLLAKISGSAPEEEFSSAEIALGDTSLSLRQTTCRNRSGIRVARVITVTDVTEYHELAAAEKKLSIEHERNRIAQEIHDSAGHTFTMISSLARVLGAEAEKPSPDMGAFAEHISQIDGLARSGVTQLRCSINNLRDDTFMTGIVQAVSTVTGALRGVETEVCVQGTEDSRYAFCIREVYDSVRESVTNSMRYSGADRIDIILKFLPERLEVYILDNGRGCADISEHNGLKGIRSRTEALGGTVRFTSVEGEGFSTVIKIPVKEAD